MAQCSFCGRTFTSAQGVRAHLKSCRAYQQRRPTLAAPRRNQRLEDERHLERLFGRATPSPRLSAPEPREIRSVPCPSSRPPINPNAEKFRHRPQADKEGQRRAEAAHQERATRIRAILQQIKMLVIDLYFSWPPVSPAAIAEAKLAIERKLITLPLLELPLTELQQIGTGIRDQIYDRYRTPAVSVPVPTTSLITQTPNPLPPKETAMPMRKVFSGFFECPSCAEEYELDRVPEPEAKCNACHVKLVEVDEEDDDGD